MVELGPALQTQEGATQSYLAAGSRGLMHVAWKLGSAWFKRREGKKRKGEERGRKGSEEKTFGVDSFKTRNRNSQENRHVVWLSTLHFRKELIWETHI